MTDQTIGTARVDIVANADGVEVAAAKAKNSIAAMSKGARAEYDALTKREQRRIDALVRQADTIGMTRAEQLAYNAALKTSGALQQDMLARIRENSQALNEQNKTLIAGGLSAKEYAFAMRGVPAQITDIVVSLQGGQRPMTVLLQQGGQLKDMFGGMVPAAKALGATVVGMINPVTLLAAGAVALSVAWYQGSYELDEYKNHLIMTGGAIRVTTSQMSAMADTLHALPDITRGGAVAALTEVAKSGKIAGEQLELVAAVALESQSLLGKSISETVEEFERLAEEPSKAILELNEKYHFLTLAVYDQIQALEDEGREQEAARLAQQAYADSTTQRLAQVKENVGYLEIAWKKLGLIAAGAWDAMKGVGRESSEQDAISLMESQLANLQAMATKADQYRAGIIAGNEANVGFNFNSMQMGVGNEPIFGVDAKAIQSQHEFNDVLQEQIRSLQGLIKEKKDALAIDESAAEMAQYFQEVEEKGIAAAQEIGKLLDGNKSKTEQFAEATQKLHKWREELRKADPQHWALLPENIKAADDALIAKYKEKVKQSRNAASAYENEMAKLKSRLEEEQNFAKGIEQTTGQITRLNEFERRAGQLRNLAAVETKAATKAEYERLAAMNEQVGAQVSANKLAEQAAKDRLKYLDGIEKTTKKTQEEAQKLRDQAQTMGMSRVALEGLTTARLQEQAALLRGKAGKEEELKLLEQQIAARHELTSAIEQHDIAKLAADTQKEVERDWQKTMDNIDDVFRRGFADMINGGESSWKSFTKSLTTTFKTVVADEIYKMFMKPFVAQVAVGVGGMFGMAGAAKAQGAGGIDPLTGLSTAKNLMGGMNWFTDFSGSIADSVMSMGNYVSTMEGSLGKIGTSIFNSADAIGKFAEGAGAVFNYGKGIYDITKGNWGAGIGSIGGQLIGGPIGGMIGNALGGILDKAFKGETRAGAYMQYDLAAKQVVVKGGPSGGYGGQATIDAATQLFGSTVDTINSVLEGVGSQAQTAWFHGMFESSKKGRGGTFAGGSVQLADGSLVDFGTDKKGAGFGGKSGTAEEMFQNLQSEVHFAALEAWKAVGSEMPTMISDMLGGMDIRALSAEQAQASVQQIQLIVSAVGQLTTVLNQLPMINLQNLAFDAVAGVTELFGGADQAIAGIGGYYQDFYSEAERTAHTIHLLTAEFGKLGYELPASRDALRDIVDGIDLSTREGQELYVQLLQLAPTFASVTEETGGFGLALGELGELMQLLSSLPFNHLRDMGEDTVRVLADLSGGVEAFSHNLSVYYQGFFSEQERFVAAAGLLATDLSDLGLTLPTTASGFRSMMDSIDLTTQAGQELFASLLGTADQAAAYYQFVEREQQNAIAELAQLANEARQKELEILKAAQSEQLAALRERQSLELTQLKDSQSARTAEMRKQHDEQVKAVRSSYDEQAKAIRDAMSSANDKLRELSQLSNRITSGLDSLRNYSELAVDLHRTASRGLIDEAIRLAGSGRSLAGMAGLEDAVNAVGRLTAADFNSLFSYELERAESVQALKQLSSLTDGQVSVQELQLSAMEKQLIGLEDWRTAQIETLTSIAEREQLELHSLFEKEQQQLKERSDAQLGLLAQIHEDEQANLLAQVNRLLAQEQESVSRQIEEFYQLQSLQEISNQILESEGLKQRAELRAMQSGLSGISRSISGLASALLSEGQGRSIPAFAEGGYYSGGLALVGEQGPEIINFSKPGMVYTAAQSRNLMANAGSSDEVATLLRQLLGAISEMRSELRQVVLNTHQLKGVLDDVTQGGTELRVKEVHT